MTDDGFMDKNDLLERLESQSQVFQNKAIKKAFTDIDRKDFLQPDYQIEAYEDYSVPTLDGHYVTQPTTLAFMLELLDVQASDMVLDIGSGSGWSTALLGSMVGPEGRVLGLDVSADMVAHSRENLQNYKDLPVEIIQADIEAGYYRSAPYERIIAEVAFQENDTTPAELLLQLAPGGVMVLPIEDTIVKFEKGLDDDIQETQYPGFSFSPYIGKEEKE